MMQTPDLSKQEQLAWCRSLGIEPPSMYAENYGHANCGGACVRAGQRQWAHLLKMHPRRYAHAEWQEEQLRERLGDVAILKERCNGISRPLTLRDLRQRHTPAAQSPPTRRRDPPLAGQACGA